MRVLLDTHALVWWLLGKRQLGEAARRLISDPDVPVLVSAASIWEIATKHRSGKWDESGPLLANVDEWMGQVRFAPLPITLPHALAAGRLDSIHKDPFDRMLIAQSRIENLSVVTIDPVFAAHGVSVIWR
ncbi:MAG: type II toxin-antitoxin system VapC family toxin [Alphaproteobacteria bacterium]|nr:type II toxin-antitoxin system VapC family toxin [Alphaproteobacteria bacterium]